jgi:hypothetical protein
MRARSPRPQDELVGPAGSLTFDRIFDVAAPTNNTCPTGFKAINQGGRGCECLAVRAVPRPTCVCACAHLCMHMGIVLQSTAGSAASALRGVWAHVRRAARVPAPLAGQGRHGKVRCLL